jgi:putative phage-type endonuclease
MGSITADLPAGDLIERRCEVIEIDPVAQREEWLAQRHHGLGGSDIGAILGLSPYKSPMRVWAEKTGRAQDEDLSHVEAVRWGTVLEDAIAGEFALRYKVDLHRPKAMFIDREFPHLFANPDGLFEHWDDGEPTVYEGKTAGINLEGDWANGATPPWYQGQGVHYAARFGYKRVVIFCLIAGQNPVMRTIEVTDELARSVTEASDAWWRRHVVADVAPPTDDSDDCTEVLSSLWVSQDKILEVDQRAVALAAGYNDAHERLNAAKKEKVAYANALRDVLREHRTAAYAGTPVATWKPAKQFDEAAFAAADPELYARYCTLFDRKRLELEHPEVLDMFKHPTDGDRRLLVKPAATTIMENLNA